MRKRILYSSLLAVFLLSSACANLGFMNFTPQAPVSKTTLDPEFFKNSKRIAIQDFSFAEGVETNAFSPTDSEFLRSVVEAKIVEVSGLEVITRTEQGVLQEEMAYKFGKAAATDDEAPQAKEEFNQKLAVDAFVYGIIYEYDYDERSKKYSLTAAIKIVNTEDGRIWQSTIVNIAKAESKYNLFDKLASAVAKTLTKPKAKTTMATKKKVPSNTRKKK